MEVAEAAIQAALVPPVAQVRAVKAASVVCVAELADIPARDRLALKAPAIPVMACLMLTVKVVLRAVQPA
jgi:hypothetical protein